jgi:hypothetical protein
MPALMVPMGLAGERLTTGHDGARPITTASDKQRRIRLRLQLQRGAEPPKSRGLEQQPAAMVAAEAINDLEPQTTMTATLDWSW